MLMFQNSGDNEQVIEHNNPGELAYNIDIVN
jgi:hypothetical protein